MTEYINRAEIKGRIGSVRIFDTDNGKVAQFSVVTAKAYTNRDGIMTVENTWHSVRAWNRDSFPKIDTIAKGELVHVVGSMRQSRYISDSGIESSYAEIIADKLEILETIN